MIHTTNKRMTAQARGKLESMPSQKPKNKKKKSFQSSFKDGQQKARKALRSDYFGSQFPAAPECPSVAVFLERVRGARVGLLEASRSFFASLGVSRSRPSCPFFPPSQLVLHRHGRRESSEPQGGGGPRPGRPGGQHQRGPGAPGRPEEQPGTQRHHEDVGTRREPPRRSLPLLNARPS